MNIIVGMYCLVVAAFIIGAVYGEFTAQTKK
jgi:hypothetical protein